MKELFIWSWRKVSQNDFNFGIVLWVTIDSKLSRQLIGLSFTICPHVMKCGTSYPLTKKQEGGGEDLSLPVQFFLPSLSGVYGWVKAIDI